MPPKKGRRPQQVPRSSSSSPLQSPPQPPIHQGAYEDWVKDYAHSFSGKDHTYRRYNTDNKGMIDNAFDQLDTYTKFKPYRKLRHYTPTYVYRRREKFQMDTVLFTAPVLVEANGGVKYLLTIIDIFTKKAFCYATKKNDCNTALACLKDLFSKLDQLPQHIACDRGSEFKCKKMLDFMKEHQVNLYTTQTERKAAIVERFQLSLQQLLYKLMAEHNTYEWTKYLDTALDIYHARHHRSLGMSPNEAELPGKEGDKNRQMIRKRYYQKYRKADQHMAKKKPKFKVGDTVRIAVARSKFQRGYYENFTEEYFTVAKVRTEHPNPRYQLKDLTGEEVNDLFFENELVKFTPPADHRFKIEKVLETKGKGRNEQSLIRWYGWPSKFDSWIPTRDLKSI